MPGSDITLLVGILDKSGPTALVACVFAAMWWFERKEVKELQHRVVKLSAVLLSQRNTVNKDKGS